jgi:hypothetical protein
MGKMKKRKKWEKNEAGRKDLKMVKKTMFQKYPMSNYKIHTFSCQTSL